MKTTLWALGLIAIASWGWFAAVFVALALAGTVPAYVGTVCGLSLVATGGMFIEVASHPPSLWNRPSKLA